MYGEPELTAIRVVGDLCGTDGTVDSPESHITVDSVAEERVVVNNMFVVEVGVRVSERCGSGNL